MKKIYFILLLLFTTSLYSQHTSTGIGRWKLGLNVGGTWQTANINSKLLDLGFGATLEYAVHQKRSSFFGFSLRGRFLNGQTRGFNKLREYGPISNNNINGVNDSTVNYSLMPVHLNNRTKYNEFSLEAMLKWNRLYQDYGLVFYLYMGAGFTSYKVETNQQDLLDVDYDYSGISENTASTVDDIQFLLDQSYETELSHPDYKNLVFTPSVGFGFGFRVVPGFDIVYEHKTSLPQTDLFEGQIRDLDDPSFVQDIYHYSSLGLIFSIAGSVDDGEVYTPPVEPSEPIVNKTPVDVKPTKPIKPVITLIKPVVNEFNSPNCKIEIVAKIDNISSQRDIKFYQNGNQVSGYKFFFSKPNFNTTVDLRPGKNDFKIVAQNGTLTETKTFSLNCNETNPTKINICLNNQDLTIDEKDWENYASKGATKGKCPIAKKNITICLNNKELTIDEKLWTNYMAQGATKGKCPITKKNITICLNNKELTIDEKDWAKFAAQGATKGKCPVVINNITICLNNKELTIDEKDWANFAAKGATKGKCPIIEKKITICLNSMQLTINEKDWSKYAAQGATKGKCPVVINNITICLNNKELTIDEKDWAKFAAQGATRGKCPIIDKQIIICHNVPGQPGKTQTITIPESKWLIHKSHGDVKGKCITKQVDKVITICHKSGLTSSTIKIKESQWASHAAHGDSKGICPEKPQLITICHNMVDSPIASPSGSIIPKKTMVIPISEWSKHAAHGDTKGACKKENNNGSPGSGLGGGITPKKIKICLKGKSMSINESDWLIYQAQGATKGECQTKKVNKKSPSKKSTSPAKNKGSRPIIKRGG